MKTYLAVNSNDLLIAGREYIGYEKDNKITLTHVMGSSRVVQLSNSFSTDRENLREKSEKAYLGLNYKHSYKRKRGYRQ